MTKHREIWIDFCRGLAILFVVLGHAVVPFQKWIYGFHLPLFFMLSGYLYKANTPHISVPLYIKAMLKRCVLPYFILCGMNFIILLFQDLYRQTATPELELHYLQGILYSTGSISWMPNCTPLWFLTCFFCTMLLYRCIFACPSLWMRWFFIVLFPALGFLLPIFNAPHLPWNLDVAFVSIPFVACGGLFFQALHRIYKMNGLLVFLCGSTMLLGSWMITLNPVEFMGMDDRIYGNPALMLTGALFTSAAWMFLSFLWCSHLRTRHSLLTRGIVFFGRHTVFIMAFDYLAGFIVKTILASYTVFPDVYLVRFLLKLIFLCIGLAIWYAGLTLLKNKKVAAMLRF